MQAGTYYDFVYMYMYLSRNYIIVWWIQYSYIGLKAQHSQRVYAHALDSYLGNG